MVPKNSFREIRGVYLLPYYIDLQEVLPTQFSFCFEILIITSVVLCVWKYDPEFTSSIVYHM